MTQRKDKLRSKCLKVLLLHSVSKMPSIITIYGADIEIKYLRVIQSSLTECYHFNKEYLVECILKENARSCVTRAGNLFCCNDVYVSCIRFNMALQTLVT